MDESFCWGGALHLMLLIRLSTVLQRAIYPDACRLPQNNDPRISCKPHHFTRIVLYTGPLSHHVACFHIVQVLTNHTDRK